MKKDFHASMSQCSTDILLASRSNQVFLWNICLFLVSFYGEQIFLEELFLKMSFSPYRMLREKATNEFKSTSWGPVRLSGKTVHKTGELGLRQIFEMKQIQLHYNNYITIQQIFG